MPSPKRRYALQNAELDALVEELVARTEAHYGSKDRGDHVRQIVVSALKLLGDGAAPGDVKLVSSALKELRHSFNVFAAYRHVRKVAVFGSARTREGHPHWVQAHELAERMAAQGWMTITGAGPGIMQAAQGGAGRKASFGVNIRLPFEQGANEVIAGDSKLINFRYFFTRKVTFVKESHALALLPGGFGTHDEGFEALTLLQTGKSDLIPIVFLDAPGGSYWKDWEAYVRSHLLDGGLISPEDLALFKITDDVAEAVHEITHFYANYHSSRYVDDLLVLRLRRAPAPLELEQLNDEFSGLLDGGRIEVAKALRRERGEVEQLPRVTLRFNRRDTGRLRLLLDRLNAMVSEQPPAGDASPRELVEVPMSPEAEQAEIDPIAER